jgi:hypothetical protein
MLKRTVFLEVLRAHDTASLGIRPPAWIMRA